MLTLSRRAGVASLAALALAALAGAGLAQDKFPSRPVTLVVPFPPGGGTDIGARLVAQKLSERWGQAVIVENKAGAAGQIGAAFVANAKPDGYTLLGGNIGTQAINPLIYQKLSYDHDKAFQPIAQINELPLVMLVNPNLPAKTLPDLIAMAKDKPDTVTYASSGAGGSPHLAAALLEKIAGVKMVHVPYKGGGPAAQDLMAGQVNLLFATILEGAGNIRGGKLRGLVVTSEKRSPVLPDVPTIAETYPGYQANSWLGLLAPAGTPMAIVEQIAADVRWAVDQPDVREKFLAQGATPKGTDPATFAATIAADRKRYEAIIREQGIKAD